VFGRALRREKESQLVVGKREREREKEMIAGEEN